MIAGAIRSRLFELRRDRAAAQRSAELLERKREVLLRDLLRRARRAAALRNEAAAATRGARHTLGIARVQLGLRAIESAALAQPPALKFALTSASVMGVRLPRLSVEERQACLSPTGEAFAELLALLATLAEEEASLARLRMALRKVTKLSGALRKVVLPRIEREIRAVVEEIEEEERDEAVRRGRWRARARI